MVFVGFSHLLNLAIPSDKPQPKPMDVSSLKSYQGTPLLRQGYQYPHRLSCFSAATRPPSILLLLGRFLLGHALGFRIQG